MKPVIAIDPALIVVLPHLALGVVTAPIRVSKHDTRLWCEIDTCIASLRSNLTPSSLSTDPEIAAARDSYRTLGKDASRYRSSAEALARRVLQGKELYKINTIVDLNNLLSLETMCSVGAYDLDRIGSPTVFRIGVQGEAYKGIGKETINLESLPVFADCSGPYGSPTSDSERAMISEQTENLLLVVISFAGISGLQASLDRASELLATYAEAPKELISTFIISLESA